MKCDINKVKDFLHYFGDVVVLLQVRLEGRNSAVGVFAQSKVCPLKEKSVSASVRKFD